jgi:hypothetical protein
MSGQRLLIGAVVMGILVPLILFFVLPLETLSQFFTASAVTFLAWCVADFAATILSRKRLDHRSPGSAIREWESASRDDAQE